MDTFTQAYIEALLWSETDEAGNPLDAKYSIDDIAKDSLEGIIKECAKFQVLNAPFLFPLYCEIDDNGIGREQSQKLKMGSDMVYESHGMELTRQRLALVSKSNGSDYEIEVADKNEANEPTGTTIIIKFPTDK